VTSSENQTVNKQTTQGVGDWLFRAVKGFFIGTGFILPGISGGVLAAVFGIYERLVGFLANLTKNFKKNFLFFLPVGIGAVVSIVLCSYALVFFFDRYMVQILWFFAGCIIGTIPALWRQAGREGRTPVHIAVLVISAVVAYAFLFGMKDFAGEVPENFLTWIMAGALIALGFLIPGLSPSNFLLYMGMYRDMADGFKNLDVMVILPIAIGGVACVLLLSKLVNWLLHKVYSGMFHFILGVVIASTVMIIPMPLNYGYLDLDVPAESTGIAPVDLAYANWWGFVICGVVCLAGAALGWWMSKLEDKYVPEED
jgi:putative membrane protein